MMMNFFRLTLCLLAVLASTSTFAARETPVFPSDCFSDAAYCVNTQVVEDNGRRIIRTRLYGFIEKSMFSSAQDLVNLYQDFANWPNYMEGNDVVKMLDSRELPSITTPEGKVIRRHYAHYSSPAPFPIWKVTAREVAHYEDIEPYAGADVAIRFEVQTDKEYDLPNARRLRGAEGVKYKVGELYIEVKEDGYYVFAESKVVPAIDLLPTVAAPYVEKGVVALFKGILGL